MLRHAARRTKLHVLLVTLTALYGCSDAPLPVAPRVPTGPQTLVGPVATVTNTDDSGPGSLRDIIAAAVPGTTIQFDPTIAGQTIVLSTTWLEVGKPLTIEGPAATGITISGGLSTRVLTITTGATVVLRNLSITNGHDSFGAGVLMTSGSLTLDHVLVANNEASNNGGGITIKDGDLIIVNSTISGNVAVVGAGIDFGGNSLLLRNSTIAENTAVSAGGLYAPVGTVTFRNSIIGNNVDVEPGNTPEADCRFGSAATPVYVGTNLSSDGSCGPSTSIMKGDAKILPLASYGGPTFTHGLLNESPAIDAGTMCTETSDQRYVSRPQGTSCDIGAFEFNDFGTYTIAINPNAAINSKTGVATVSGTVSCSKPTTASLRVSLNQTQKVTGKFTTIVQGDALTAAQPCTAAPSSWTAVITPTTGKFDNGTATGRAVTESALPGFLASDITTALKLYSVK